MEVINNSHPTKDSNRKSGLTSFCSWEALQPFIGHCVHLKPSEKIEAITIEDQGIRVMIGKKELK